MTTAARAATVDVRADLSSGAPRRAGDLRGDLADVDQRLHRAARPARDPGRARTRRLRLFTHLQATDPERFLVADRTRRDAASASSRSRRRSSASGCGTCRCCSCCPSSRARRRARAAGPRAGRRPTRTRPTASGRPPRTAPSRSRTRCTPLRHRPADAAAQPDRAAAAAGGVRASAVGGRAARLRRDRGAGRRTARVIGCWSMPSTRSIASCSASPTRSTTDSCAANRATAGSIAARTARRSATATPARPAGSARSRSATRRSSAPILGHLTSAVVPRGAFAHVGRRRGGPGGRPGPAGRLPARPFPVLLCWDRPFADFSPLPADLARPALTTEASPDRRSGASWHRRSRLPDLRPGGSLDRCGSPCRARGRSREIVTIGGRGRRGPSPAEPNVTIAPAPSAPRSRPRRARSDRGAEPRATRPSRNGRSSSSTT